MKISSGFVALGLLSLPGVIAWGELGHYTTAYLGSYFVSNTTEKYLKDLLGNNNVDYLASIATFADHIKQTPHGEPTSGWHYIDAHDDPKSNNCNVDYHRDCKQKEGCVIRALTNLTHQALDPQISDEDREFAVKLIVHFIGDLHQPLHNEDIAKGGTEISVQWPGSRGPPTLHRVWDTNIPERVAKNLKSNPHDPPLEWASEWADKLKDEISDGKFAAEKNEWLDKLDLSDPLSTALEWSREANWLVCQNVFIPGYEPSNIEGKDLSKAKYYTQAGPVVEKQIARAGYRMAAWLSEVVTVINNWEKDGDDSTEEL